jgi:hypothetical protein
MEKRRSLTTREGVFFTSTEPQLNLTYDADGKLSGAECSSCGVGFGKFLARIREEWLKTYFDLHVQARHSEGESSPKEAGASSEVA